MSISAYKQTALSGGEPRGHTVKHGVGSMVVWELLFFQRQRSWPLLVGKSIELKSGRQTVTDLKKRKSETKDEVCVLTFNMKEQIKAC